MMDSFTTETCDKFAPRQACAAVWGANGGTACTAVAKAMCLAVAKSLTGKATLDQVKKYTDRQDWEGACTKLGYKKDIC